MNTCSGCKHWHAAPPNPQDLAAPRLGECRGGPPQLVVLPGPVNGSVAIQCAYPATEARLPACAQFRPPDPDPEPGAMVPSTWRRRWQSTLAELARLEAAGEGASFAAGALRDEADLLLRTAAREERRALVALALAALNDPQAAAKE